MALQTSGQISLNDIHVEAGGTSQTMCSMNDTDIRGLTAAAGKTINSTLGTESDFADYYGASSITYMEIIPASGTYTTYTTGDYRYYLFGAGVNTAPLLNSIGNSDSGRIYWRMWGAGGGGGGGGQYAGADGGAGSYTEGYYVPTATGYLRIQVGTGGSGGENMNSNGLPTVDGGAGGQPGSISTTNLLGGTGGNGYGGTASGYVGGGGGGGGATRIRTNWSTGSPASPTFEVWAGAGGGGGGSDQNATGAPTPGGSGGSGLSNAGMGSTSSGLTASSIGNSGGGGGAITNTSGGTGGTGTGGSNGQAGVLYHGGDGGSGPSNFFGGSGGGGAGQYGGGGGGTGSSSQGAGGGGGSGYVSGSVTVQNGVRQSLGNRNSPVTYIGGWSITDAQGGLKGPQTTSFTSTITRAGDGGPGKVVLYHKFQN